MSCRFLFVKKAWACVADCPSVCCCRVLSCLHPCSFVYAPSCSNHVSQSSAKRPALQVRGTDALKAFSANLMAPYVPTPLGQPGSREAVLEAEVARLRARVAELEAKLGGR